MAYYFDTLPLHPPPELFESFTSYLMRLAEMNKIKHTEKLASMCLPNQNIHTLRIQRDYPPKSFKEMQQATTWDEEVLKKTTFYHVGANLGCSMEPTSLSRFMSSSVSSHLRYCPSCLADYSYYFLPWRFLTLNGCYRHSCQLLDRCGHCEYLIPFLSPLLQMNICPRCRGDLRKCRSISLSEDTREDARKIYQDLEFLLSFHRWNISCSDRAIALGREFAAIRQEKGLRLKEVSYQIGLGVGSLRLIELGESGRQGASLSVFLKYAEHLGIDLHSLGNKLLNHMNEDQYRNLSGKDLYKVEDLMVMIPAAIQNLKRQGKPITMKNINSEVNISSTVLLHYPKAKVFMQQCIDDYIYGKIKSKQFSNTKLRENTRLKDLEKAVQREEYLLREVSEAIQYLKLNNLRITINAIEHKTGLHLAGYWGKYPKVRRLIEENSPRRKQMRKLYIKQEEILPRVLAAIQHLREMEQPITKKAIAKIVGIPPSALDVYPEVSSIITTLQKERWRGYSHEQMEKDTLLKVQVAIQRLRELGQSVTKVAIVREAGIGSARINKYPHVVIVVKSAIEEQQQLNQSEWNERNTLIKVQESISRLEDMGKPITRETIARDCGIADYKLRKYRNMTQFIDKAIKEKEKKSLEKQFCLREEQLVCDVLLAIQQLQLLGLVVTKKAVSKIVDVSISGLLYYPKVKIVLEEAIENSRAMNKKGFTKS